MANSKDPDLGAVWLWSTLLLRPIYHRVMSPKYADGIANSVAPDHTAPLWSVSTLFAQAYLP